MNQLIDLKTNFKRITKCLESYLRLEKTILSLQTLKLFITRTGTGRVNFPLISAFTHPKKNFP